MAAKRKTVKGPDSPACNCAQLSARYLIARPTPGRHFVDCDAAVAQKARDSQEAAAADLVSQLIAHRTPKGAKIHYSYAAHVGQPMRPDLKPLAVCNNINGALGLKISSDLSKVTCGRCLQIRST